MVIKISDETQFKNYLLDVENNLYDINGEYCLDRNIDWNLIEYKFRKPILKFTGVFDGSNNIIKNFSLDNSEISSDKFVGLFGYAFKCTIKNLILELNGNLYGLSNKGCLVGKGYKLKLRNCDVKGSIIFKHIEQDDEQIKPENIGFIAGSLEKSEIDNINVYLNGDIQAYNCTGGFVGYSKDCKINDIFFYFYNVKINAEKNVGGFIGYSEKCIINNIILCGNLDILNKCNFGYRKRKSIKILFEKHFTDFRTNLLLNEHYNILNSKYDYKSFLNLTQFDFYQFQFPNEYVFEYLKIILNENDSNKNSLELNENNIGGFIGFSNSNQIKDSQVNYTGSISGINNVSGFIAESNTSKISDISLQFVGYINGINNFSLICSITKNSIFENCNIIDRTYLNNVLVTIENLNLYNEIGDSGYYANLKLDVDPSNLCIDYSDIICDISSIVCDVSSEISDVSSIISDVSSEISDVSSNISDVSSEISDVSSNISDVSSEICSDDNFLNLQNIYLNSFFNFINFEDELNKNDNVIFSIFSNFLTDEQLNKLNIVDIKLDTLYDILENINNIFNLGWDKLSEENKKKFEELNIDEYMFNNKIFPNLKWNDLTGNQKKVANSLGFSKIIWDEKLFLNIIPSYDIIQYLNFKINIPDMILNLPIYFNEFLLIRIKEYIYDFLNKEVELENINIFNNNNEYIHNKCFDIIVILTNNIKFVEKDDTIVVSDQNLYYYIYNVKEYFKKNYSDYILVLTGENLIDDLNTTLNDITCLEIINIENSFFDKLPADIKIAVNNINKRSMNTDLSFNSNNNGKSMFLGLHKLSLIKNNSSCFKILNDNCYGSIYYPEDNFTCFSKDISGFEVFSYLKNDTIKDNNICIDNNEIELKKCNSNFTCLLALLKSNSYKKPKKKIISSKKSCGFNNGICTISCAF